MVLECKKNKFFASMLNSKKIKEVQFSYLVDGHYVFYSNLEILQIFLNNSDKNRIIQVQQIFQKERYNVNVINSFAYEFGKEFIIKHYKI